MSELGLGKVSFNDAQHPSLDFEVVFISNVNGWDFSMFSSKCDASTGEVEAFYGAVPVDQDDADLAVELSNVRLFEPLDEDEIVWFEHWVHGGP